MRDCKYYEDLLRALPGKKLTDDERSALRAHLNECSSCRSLFNDLHTQYTAQRGRTSDPAPVHKTSPAPVRNTRNTPAKEKSSPLRFVLPVLIVCLLAAAAVILLHSCGKSDANLSESTTYTDTDADAENTPIVIAAFNPDTKTEAVSENAEPAEADTTSDTESAADQSDSGSIGLNSVDNPAVVPDGQDSAFEALLTSDVTDADPAALNSICAAEYHGVIYEFLTDADGALYWRDAAEGVTAQRSIASTDDLWSVLGPA